MGMRFGVAEFAGTRADVSSNHESGRSPSPTFAEIGASSAGADSMQSVCVDNPFRFGIARVCADVDFKPFRLSDVFHFFE